MKLFRILILAAAIPALSASVYAGDGCGKCGDKDKKKEEASVENVQALGSCGKCGDKEEKKDGESA